MSSRHAIREGIEEAMKERVHEASELKLKASRELVRLTFSYFSEALENYFSKFRVLIP